MQSTPSIGLATRRRREVVAVRRLLLASVPFIVIVCVWAAAVWLGVLPSHLFPEPYELISTFSYLVTSDALLANAGITILRVVIAGAIGLSLGVALGALISVSPRLASVLQTFTQFFQGIGEIGWLPILVLWLGFNNTTIIVTVAYTVFFPVFFSTTAGFSDIPKNLRDSIRVLGGGRFAVIRDVMLPGALPAIITGFRTGMGFGWRTVILAELLIGGRGLGVILFQASEAFRPAWIIVEMIVIGAVWLLFDSLFLVPLERRTIERWGLVR